MIVHKTSRLLLETWHLEDFEAFALVARNPEVMRYIANGKPWSDSRIGWFMGLQKGFQDTLGYCNWKLTDRSDGELIGFCGLASLPVVGGTEIGWWLKPAYWGRGFAFEAAEQVVDCAFSKHALNGLVARVYRSNERSIKLIERLGMSYDRPLDTNAVGEVLLFSINCDLRTKRQQ